MDRVSERLVASASRAASVPVMTLALARLRPTIADGSMPSPATSAIFFARRSRSASTSGERSNSRIPLLCNTIRPWIAMSALHPPEVHHQPGGPAGERRTPVCDLTDHFVHFTTNLHPIVCGDVGAGRHVDRDAHDHALPAGLCLLIRGTRCYTTP